MAITPIPSINSHWRSTIRAEAERPRVLTPQQRYERVSGKVEEIIGYASGKQEVTERERHVFLQVLQAELSDLLDGAPERFREDLLHVGSRYQLKLFKSRYNI
jgi:hypothetical protein